MKRNLEPGFLQYNFTKTLFKRKYDYQYCTSKDQSWHHSGKLNNLTVFLPFLQNHGTKREVEHIFMTHTLPFSSSKISSITYFLLQVNINFSLSGSHACKGLRQWLFQTIEDTPFTDSYPVAI